MSEPALAGGISAAAIIGTNCVVATAGVFNTTHLSNPDWPRHSRFHTAIQSTTLAMVSVISLAALIGPFGPRCAWQGALAPLTFWPGLFVAWVVPGTGPYASEALGAVGVPINLVLAAVLVALTLAGAALANSVAAVPHRPYAAR